jgi:hypothetical protein
VLREHAPAALAAALVALAFATPLHAQRPDAFEVVDLPTRGRVLDAFAARDAQGAAWLAVVSVEGMPPDEKRFVTLFARGEAKGALPIAIPASVAAVDVADAGGPPGCELLLLEARQLRILDARGALVRAIPLDPALPYPPRSRGLGRLDFARDWLGDGTLAAVVPDVEGLRFVPISREAPAQVLPLPFSTIYGDLQQLSPVREGFFRMELRWPSLTSADDDGDGRLDLIATTRYALTTFRGEEGRFSAKPARVRRFPAFSFEEERRADTNLLLTSAADLDGDGDADLVAHRTTGMLTGSRAETRIHANPGRGADPLAAPEGTLSVEGGVAGADLEDLDGDGRPEIVQSVLPFGMAQLARILVRGQAELELRVFAFDKGELGTPVLRWSDDVSLPFDFKTSRITTLFPKYEGDYNGDGRRDLMYGDSAGNARIRLGRANGGGFGSEVAEVPLAANGGQSLSADLDGDRLAELVYWDPIVRSGRLRVARNLGKLPGSPPRMAPTAR